MVCPLRSFIKSEFYGRQGKFSHRPVRFKYLLNGGATPLLSRGFIPNYGDRVTSKSPKTQHKETLIPCSCINLQALLIRSNYSLMPLACLVEWLEDLHFFICAYDAMLPYLTFQCLGTSRHLSGHRQTASISFSFALAGLHYTNMQETKIHR
jgi:hypothetical protein